MVREIDVSKITLRLAEKKDDHGDVGEKHVIGKLQGPTLQTLQQCLVCFYIFLLWPKTNCCSTPLPNLS